MLRIFLLMIFMAPEIFATNIPSGHEVGNGGYFFVCDSSSPLGVGVFAMDRIEGETVFSLYPANHFKNFSREDEIIAVVLNDLRRLNPLRANQYDKWFTEIFANKNFVKDLAIRPIADTGTVVTPHGCTMRQAAVFMTEEGVATGRFIYDEDLWNQASVLDRAYLLLHEIIYQEAKLPENAHLNSMATRYLNAFLFASSGTLRETELIQILIQTKFKRAEYHGVPLILTSVASPGQHVRAPIDYFNNSPYIRQAIVDDTFTLRIGKKSFVRKCAIPHDTVRENRNRVEFYSKGTLKRLVFEVFPNIPGCGSIEGSNSFEFDESGEQKASTVILGELTPAALKL